MTLKNDVLKETDNFLSSLVKKSDKPTDIEFIFYILAKEFGITKIDDYEIPYLNVLIKTYNHAKKEEEKQMKRARRK